MLQRVGLLEQKALPRASCLRLLIVEDVPEDVELIVFALENAGVKLSYDVAQTAQIYCQLLRQNSYDAILADYHLPRFNGLQAFKLLQQSTRDIPFILVTGHLGEQGAVECMRAGMTDYVVKDSLFRLPTVLERALQEFELRRQRQTALSELQKSEQRFRALIENATDIIIILDSQKIIRYISPSVKRILGYSPETLIGKSFMTILHPDELLMFLQRIDQIRENTGISKSPVEYRLSHCQGSWYILEAVMSNLIDEPAVQGIVINCHDITERKKFEAQLQHDAFYDILTGLANRALFLDRLGQVIKHSQRKKQRHFAVIFLVLDRFKMVNESLGHLVGDQLLIAFARRLEQCPRKVDTVARLGGDEFVVLLEDIPGVDEALKVAERIHQTLARPFFLDNQEVFVTASIGIAPSSPSYEHPEQVLRDADTAMYYAKSRGKARHEVFTPSMHVDALRQLHLENDLRRAIERQELVVYYQPIVRLESHTIEGFEALVRWQHPERGLVSPLEFIPIAEETGLIIPLDQWVLRSACQQVRLWHQEFSNVPPFTISVNLSGKQFAQPDLIQQIDQILAETGLEGQYLKLEITESVLIEKAEVAAAMLVQLKARNIQVCIDDFGTGYSSLSYLHRFPIDVLKIDRSFVKNIGMNHENSAIVRTIATMAQELKLGLIAEGVETTEQMTYLKILGCQWGQGYHFSCPVDSEKMANCLKFDSSRNPFSLSGAEPETR